MVYKKGTLAKRVSRVEAQQRRQRPVMKMRTFQFTPSLLTNTALFENICSVASGSEVSNRIGNKIKVFRVEVRGIVDPGIDLFLIQAHTNDAPSITTFTTSRGCYIDTQNTDTKISEWWHYSVPDVVAHNFKRTQRFRNGFVVKYNGTSGTNTVDNVLYVGAVNRSTSTQAADMGIRIWYTDS